MKLIRVSVNGIQLPDVQPKQGAGFAPGRLELTAPLAQGENAVTLIGVNTEGYESEPLRVRLTHEGEGSLDKPRTLYLVSIGVDGGLVRVLPEWGSPEVTIHLVFTARRGLPPAVRAFIDHLVAESLGGHGATLDGRHRR